MKTIEEEARSEAKRINAGAHMTGYRVYLYGESYWHRTLAPAIARARAAGNWCQNAQVIEIATGAMVYGRAE